MAHAAPLRRADASCITRWTVGQIHEHHRITAGVFTFVIARVTVFLIVSRRLPDLYLHVGGTHVHHLNYGIFLLSAVGGHLVMFVDSFKYADRLLLRVQIIEESRPPSR